LNGPSKNSRRPIAVLVWRSHLVVRPLRGLQATGANRCSRPVSPSSDFIPASEFSPVDRDTVLRCRLLSRGLFPLQRYRTVTSHRSRSCLLRVMLRPCRSCRLRRLAPVTVSPACFIRARSWGFSLQSLTRQGSLSPLGAASPPAIGVAASHYRTDQPSGGSRLPGPAPGSVAFRLQRMVRWSSVLLSEVPLVPDH